MLTSSAVEFSRQKIIRQQFFYYHPLPALPALCEKENEAKNDNEVPRNEIIVAKPCGIFYWKILCCHDYGSAIDINDVLHYYQFYFVPDFSFWLRFVTLCSEHKTVNERRLCSMSLRNYNWMSHSRKFR